MLRTIRKIITLNYLENCCLDCFKSKETNFDMFRVPSIILEANGVELGRAPFHWRVLIDKRKNTLNLDSRSRGHRNGRFSWRWRSLVVKNRVPLQRNPLLPRDAIFYWKSRFSRNVSFIATSNNSILILATIRWKIKGRGGVDQRELNWKWNCTRYQLFSYDFLRPRKLFREKERERKK